MKKASLLPQRHKAVRLIYLRGKKFEKDKKKKGNLCSRKGKSIQTNIRGGKKREIKRDKK